MQRLEHGHRLVAETVGLMIGVLCAWIWRSKWALPFALIGSFVLAAAAYLGGAPRQTVAHIGLWSSVAIFAFAILWESRWPEHVHGAAVRWLAFAAFGGVCVQAVLGGLRVTTESGGDAVTATIFRVVHGCFAQLELCLLVAVAALLSPVWHRIRWTPHFPGIAWLGWVAAIAIYLQLVVGATMRHLGAGLAIPTFPHAAPDGRWLPAVHNAMIDLNFTHTRVGAVIVVIAVAIVVLRTLGNALGEVHLLRPAALLGGLAAAQVAVGMFVVWQTRPPMLTTLHVVNGAAVLATTVLIIVRVSRAPRPATRIPAEPAPNPAEVHA